MLKIIAFLLFVPSMTFGLIPGISSAPYAILLIPFFNRFQLGRIFIAILILSVITILQSFVFDLSLSELFKSLVALLNATLVIPFILNISEEEEKFFHKIFIWYVLATILIGILQYNFLFIRNVSAFIFGHASGFGTKGVPGLSYEPARSALDLVYAIVGVYFFFSKKKWFPYFMIISFSYLILINRSLTGILLLMIFIVIKYLWKFKFQHLLIITISIFILPIFSLGLFEGDSGIHALDSLKRLFNSSNKYELFQSLSGHRGTGLIVSWQNISLFGNGGGSWEWLTQKYLEENFQLISTISYYRNAGLVASPPLTFFGRYIMEIGVFGLLVYFGSLIKFKFVLQMFKKTFKNAELFFLSVSLIILSYGSNPIPFILFVLIFKNLKRNELRDKLYTSS